MTHDLTTYTHAQLEAGLASAVAANHTADIMAIMVELTRRDVERYRATGVPSEFSVLDEDDGWLYDDDKRERPDREDMPERVDPQTGRCE